MMHDAADACIMPHDDACSMHDLMHEGMMHDAMISTPLLTGKPLLCQGNRYAAYMTYAGLFKAAVKLQVPCVCSSTNPCYSENPAKSQEHSQLLWLD